MTLAAELQKLGRLSNDIQNSPRNEATRAISEARDRARNDAKALQQRQGEHEIANRKLKDSLATLLTAVEKEDIFAHGVFASRDSKQVWGTSATGETYLNMKGTSQLVLGDSIDVAVTRGNIYSVNLAYDDRGLLKYPAPAGTPADDSEGPRIISLSGISSEVRMGEVVLQEEDLYHDVDPPAGDGHEGATSRARAPSLVTLANVQKTKLRQASLHVASAKLIVEAEGLGDQVLPDLENCQYASFTLSSADPLGADLLDTIPLGVNVVGSEQSRRFFDEDGMQGHEYIVMPAKMKEHIGSDKVSRLQYTKTARQITLSEMESLEQVSYTKNFSFVSNAGQSHNWSVMSPTKTTDTYAAAVMDNEMTAVSLTMKVMGVDLKNALGTVRMAMDAYIVHDSTDVSSGFETYVGCKIKNAVAVVDNCLTTVATAASSILASCVSVESAQLSSRDAAVEVANRGVVAQQGSFAVLSPRVQMVMSSCQIFA